ncbi:hypothetical protein [Streptomyces sp. ODS28]|uniref:hypothetical protein n=1 Tax=Streptomyces sp. ODS28 TaxID=3136688 RepID=UPI0031EA87E8
MGTSRTLRYTALGALALLAALPVTTTGSRVADAASRSATPARSGAPQSTLDRVADFYGSYVDGLYDSGRSPLTHALRRHYLTADLRRDLARWEATHHQDGVVRGEGVPVRWSVVYNDSGTGHTWSRVTLTWEDAEHRTRTSRLLVQSDLETKLISGIETIT